jgi:hypothetical protein
MGVMETRNSETLLDFIRYCIEHPHERFWQALRNWAGQDFILFSNFAPHDFGKADGWLKDTFHRIGK